MNLNRLSWLVCVLPLVAAAQSTVVTREAEGEAAIVDRDEQRAFQQAQEQALRSAVEQAAGVRIDADSLVVNNQLVRDQIFANTSGYVKSFQVLEKKSEKNAVTVKVKAEVITDHLEQDLAAARDVVKRMGRPSLVIVLQEQTFPLDGKAVFNSDTMATVLTEGLKKDGWDIKDPQAINGKLKLGGAVTLGATELKEISDLSKADYVLYGQASFRHQDFGAGLAGKVTMFPVTAEYGLALAATDSGDQIVKLSGKLTRDPRGPDPLISYERSAHDLVTRHRDELVAPVRKAILEHFRDQLVNGQKLSVSVKGLPSFTAAKDFKKSMETMKGIREATQDGFTNGTARYRITYLGSAQDLAEQVEAVTFQKKKLAVVSVTGNTLEVQVAK